MPTKTKKAVAKKAVAKNKQAKAVVALRAVLRGARYVQLAWRAWQDGDDEGGSGDAPKDDASEDEE